MKKFIQILSFFIPCIALCQGSQNQKSEGGTSHFMGLRYKMKGGQQVYFLDNKEEKSLKVWSNKLSFSIIDEVDDTIFIRFNKIFVDPDTLKNLVDYEKYINVSNSEKKYYLLNKPKHSYSYKYQAFTTGTLILPIKIRFRVDSFPAQASPDVSVGPFIGYQFGKKDFYSQKENNRTHTFALFAAPGLIPVNSSNSTDSPNRNSTNFGISCGGGYLYELNKFQMGLFVGYDFVFGDPAKTWIYQPFRNSNIPWISIAIGFNFRKDE
jgi:hypothetical protein